MPFQVPSCSPRRAVRRWGVVAGLVIAAAGWLAAPRRFVVEGLSMGPGLLPGDVVRTRVFPAFDALRRPRRFERWVLEAADGLALKRVVGLPGEEVALVAGDLAVDGAIVVAGPRVLAGLGSRLADDAAGEPGAQGGGWAWSRPGGEVLDDAAFDAEATRVLAPVRDVGLAGIVEVRDASPVDPAEIRIRVGDAVRAQPLPAPGRHAVVAGRLDGRLVVAAWRMPAGRGPTGPRDCLPSGAPEDWLVCEPWPEPAADSAPALALDGGARATVVDIWRWRDVAWRPGADGRARYSIGPAEVLVLGDHPPASTDSRRWGPVAAAALRHAVAASAAP